MSMSRQLTIVMYHYVRDLKNSRFPEIKGLDQADFLGQLDYIVKRYEPVRMEDVIAVTRDRTLSLPENAILLTFDDGYIDHYEVVFPVLDRLGIQGSFYPPGRSVLEHKVLDVNKIHFVLASVSDKSRLVTSMENAIETNHAEFDLKPLQYYRDKYAHPNQWDSAEIIYIKRMLQRGLPEDLRNRIIDELFREFVTCDETAFAHELYASSEQLECMRRHGMHIGSHGYEHYWFDSLSRDQQANEIDRSLSFLRTLGCDVNHWTMCYPHGGYNADTLDLLRDRDCALGLTCNVGTADLDSPGPLELSRLDTTSLPYSRES